MIRKLSIDDLHLIKKILPADKVELFTNTYLTNLKTWHAFGFFKNDQITGVSASYYNIESTEWYLLTQYADDPADLEEMVKEVVEYYEQKKLYRVFWLDADHYIDFMKNFIPKRYLHFKEYSVSPFIVPRTPQHYYVLYDQKMFPVNTHVYMSVLPDEYRNG